MPRKVSPKLYQIWHVGKQVYPLIDIITVIPEYRNDVISTDVEKLQRVCDHYNRIGYDDARYEIRELCYDPA